MGLPSGADQSDRLREVETLGWPSTEGGEEAVIVPTKFVVGLAIILVFVVGAVGIEDSYGYLFLLFVLPGILVTGPVLAQISLPLDDAWDPPVILASMLVASLIWCAMFWGAWRFGRARSRRASVGL